MHDELAKQNNPADPRRQTRIYDIWNRQHRNEFWCEEWKDFDNFYEWANKTYEKGKRLNRIDRNKDFGPDNCIWGAKEQVNRKPRNRYEYNGENLSTKEIYEKYKIGEGTFLYRLGKGMSVEQAIETPLCSNGRKRNIL